MHPTGDKAPTDMPVLGMCGHVSWKGPSEPANLPLHEEELCLMPQGLKEKWLSGPSTQSQTLLAAALLASGLLDSMHLLHTHTAIISPYFVQKHLPSALCSLTKQNVRLSGLVPGFVLAVCNRYYKIMKIYESCSIVLIAYSFFKSRGSPKYPSLRPWRYGGLSRGGMGNESAHGSVRMLYANCNREVITDLHSSAGHCCKTVWPLPRVRSYFWKQKNDCSFRRGSAR